MKAPLSTDPVTRYADEPLPRTVHVHVRYFGRTANGDWRTAWIQTKARTLEEAIKAAEALPEVKQVYEASWIPGGVPT